MNTSSSLEVSRVFNGLMYAGMPSETAKREAARLCKEAENEHTRCPDKHTPQTPNKDVARQWGLGSCDKDSELLTISPGAFGGLRWMNWEGPIWMCDICKPCVDNATKMRRYYDTLKIQKPLYLSIQDATRFLVGQERTPIIDMDLAFTLPYAMPILTDVLRTLKENDVHTKVLLTYVNHRDGLGTGIHADNTRRIKFLKSHLPKGVKLADIHTYASGWSNEHHSYSKGSAMAVADIRT